MEMFFILDENGLAFFQRTEMPLRTYLYKQGLIEFDYTSDQKYLLKGLAFENHSKDLPTHLTGFALGPRVYNLRLWDGS